MKKKLLWLAVPVLILALVLTFLFLPKQPPNPWPALQKGYQYAFPLVLMHTTREKMTNTVDATHLQAPVNQFIHAAALASAESRDVVTPNVDTVYSQVWLDLSDAPVVLKKPQVQRYCSFAVLDAYTNCVAVLGTGGDGQAENTYLLTGPGYQGDVPAGMTQVSLPTNMGWIIGRTLCSGPEDLPQVHRIQDAMWVGPLPQYETGADPERGSFDPNLNGAVPLERVLAMTPAEFFQLANTLMAANPPAPEDGPLMQTLAKVGIGPGLAFDPSILGSDGARQWKAMLSGLRDTLVADSAPYLVQNGIWSCYGAPIAEFGTAYSYRTLVALAGLGANPVSVAIYPKAMTDSEGNRLNGANGYVLRFEKGMLPPVEEQGFWSITAYNSADDLLIENPIGRYCINDRSDVVYGEDGSLEIYLQTEPPAQELLSNWLPVCEGEFHLHLRIYLPEAAALDGDWAAPGILPAK